MRIRSILLALLAVSCGGGGNSSDKDQPSVGDVRGAGYKTIAIEVDYQVGAEPYVGSAGRFDDVWQITRENVTRAFASTQKTVTVPNQLAQMESFTDFAQASFTQDDILRVAGTHRQTRSANGTASFYVVWLNGYFDDGNGPNQDILGVSLGRTGVLAIFKPVIASSESPVLPGLAKALEQSTLVHELGHAFGLVNDGVALASAHEDTAHPHHCTNEKCVMNWSAARVGSAVAIARAFLTTGSTVVYDAACLGDLDAAR